MLCTTSGRHGPNQGPADVAPSPVPPRVGSSLFGASVPLPGVLGPRDLKISDPQGVLTVCRRLPILRGGVEGCEIMQTRSCVAWACDFPSLSFSFLIYKKNGHDSSYFCCFGADGMRVICKVREGERMNLESPFSPTTQMRKLRPREERPQPKVTGHFSQGSFCAAFHILHSHRAGNCFRGEIEQKGC